MYVCTMEGRCDNSCHDTFEVQKHPCLVPEMNSLAGTRYLVFVACTCGVSMKARHDSVLPVTCAACGQQIPFNTEKEA